MGSRIENSLEGITPQIGKKAESAGILRLNLQLHDAIYWLQFYPNSLIHILSLSNSHNDVASIQKTWGDKSDHVIVALHLLSLIELGNQLYDWIKKLGNLLAGCRTLFLVDDIIADETLDKRRQPLLGLAISGRHKGYSLWLLTQCYTTVPMNIRRQVKMLHVWYPKKRGDWDTIHEENDVIET